MHTIGLHVKNQKLKVVYYQLNSKISAPFKNSHKKGTMQAKTFDIKMVKLVLRCTAQKKVAKIPDLSISNSN